MLTLETASPARLSDHGYYGLIPFPFQSESRRTDEDSALARLGGATTYPIEMEMELLELNQAMVTAPSSNPTMSSGVSAHTPPATLAVLFADIAGSTML